jgi:DNA polymerase/3'-5' exonuclease PolX
MDSSLIKTLISLLYRSSDKSVTFKIKVYNQAIEEIDNGLNIRSQSVREKLMSFKRFGFIQYFDASICSKPFKIIGPWQTDNEDLNKYLKSFCELNILMNAKVGIGPKTLIILCNSGLDLETILHNKHEFNTGIYKSLSKFEDMIGYSHLLKDGVMRVPRIEADSIVKKLQSIVFDDVGDVVGDDVGKDVKSLVAGSYARGSEKIKDIDFVVIATNEEHLKLAFNKIIKKMRPISCEKTFRKLRLIVKDLRIPIEVYGYVNDIENFWAAEIDRSLTVNEHRRLRILAAKKGFRLSGAGLTSFNGSEVSNVSGISKISDLESLKKFLE